VKGIDDVVEQGNLLQGIQVEFQGKHGHSPVSGDLMDIFRILEALLSRRFDGIGRLRHPSLTFRFMQAKLEAKLYPGDRTSGGATVSTGIIEVDSGTRRFLPGSLNR
jgi:hypothetical protein